MTMSATLDIDFETDKRGAGEPRLDHEAEAAAQWAV